MHICQVVTSWENGGLEKHVIELSNALSLHHQVTVIVHPIMADKFAASVNVVMIDFAQSRWSPRLYWQLRDALNALNPDIIHAQASKAALLIARLRPLLTLKARYVATLHNQKGTTSMFEGFDHVIVVSPRLAPLVKKAPVTVIYNGIRATEKVSNGRVVLAERFGFDSSEPIYVAVGRLVEAKGFDLLIAAASAAQAQVLIVGEGPLHDDFVAQLKATPARVVLAGYCTDAPQLIAAADGLVISSRYEGGPYTLAESLLVDVPVISTDVGMVAEFLAADCVVPINDANALAQKLDWANTHRDEWQQLMQPAFSKAHQYLTLQAMIDHNNSVYNGLYPS